jgi:hypothetical protein
MTEEEWREEALARRPALTPAQITALRGVCQPVVCALHAETTAPQPERKESPCHKVPA